MKLSGAIRIFFILVIATYPFIIYFGIQILPPGFFGLMLVTLLAIRYVVLLPKERPIRCCCATNGAWVSDRP